MSCNNYSEIEELLRCIIDPTGGAADNNCKNINLDIIGGFQDIDPLLLSVFAELLGNVLSGELPTNLVNSLGNWIQLIGNVIALYNAQQQYQEGGPGRYYSPNYKNLNNSFCTTKAGNSSKEIKNIDKEIKELKKEINCLNNKIECLKCNKKRM